MFLYKFLYANYFWKVEKEDFLEAFFPASFKEKLDGEYFESMQAIIEENKNIFCCIIERYAPKFRIEDMSSCFVIVLFIALAEMFFLKEPIAKKIIINEAVELAKTYGDDAIKKLVNGCLHTIGEQFEDIQEYIHTSCKNL